MSDPRTKLIDRASGKPLAIGDEVKNFRNEIGHLVDLDPPQRSDQSGRVYVRLIGQTYVHHWYAGVIDAEYVDPDKESEDGC